MKKLTSLQKVKLKLAERGKSLKSSDKDIYNALKGTVSFKGLFRVAMKYKYSK